MKEYVIELDHRPGTLAGLTGVLADAGINVESLSATTHEDHGTARFIVDDASSAKQALTEAGLKFSVNHALTATIPHRPGALAEVTAALASAEINVEALYMLRTGRDVVEIAIVVDDPDLAEPILPIIGHAT